MAITVHARRGEPRRFTSRKRGGVLPGRRASLESLQLILKRWLLIVFACVAGRLLQTDIHLLSSPPPNWQHPKDFISLKP